MTAVSAGSAAVRVTAKVTSPASAVPQTRADEAAIEQVVTVADVPLRVALTADPPTAVEEGGAITLTASANRAVLAGEDATVRLTVVGPVVKPAPSSVTIAVGATSAAAVLTVADDDEVKDLGDVTVVATGGSLATDPTRLDVTVTENDAATVHTYTFTATAHQPSLATTTAASTTSTISSFSASCTANSDIAPGIGRYGSRHQRSVPGFRADRRNRSTRKRVEPSLRQVRCPAGGLIP